MNRCMVKLIERKPLGRLTCADKGQGFAEEADGMGIMIGTETTEGLHPAHEGKVVVRLRLKSTGH